MSDETKAVIVEHLLGGASVNEAYRHAGHSLVNASNMRIAAGMSSVSALESLGVERDESRRTPMNPLRGLDHHEMFVIVAGGGVSGIPTASCIEQHLRGKQRTPQAIEEAIANCRK